MSERKDPLKILGGAVSQTFQLERLDQLCSRSVFLSAAYAELIANVNACLLIDRQEDANPVITSIKIADNNFPVTPQGRKTAIGWSFWHMANKLDDYLSTANLRQLMLSLDFVQDIASSALRGTKVSQTVKKD